jgi:hypothetical protein
MEGLRSAGWKRATLNFARRKKWLDTDVTDVETLDHISRFSGRRRLSATGLCYM